MLYTQFFFSTLISFSQPYTTVNIDSTSKQDIVITTMVVKDCTMGGPVTLALTKIPSDFDPAQVFIEGDNLTFNNNTSYAMVTPTKGQIITIPTVLYLNWQAPSYLPSGSSCQVDLIGYTLYTFSSNQAK